MFKTIGWVNSKEILQFFMNFLKLYFIIFRRLDQVQAQLEEPLRDLLSKKQLPFNDSIKLQKEEVDNEVLHNVESVLLECEAKHEGEVS